MNTMKQTTKSIITGTLLSLYTLSPVWAADIEIYTSLGSNATTVKPNVLFVLDTSGSMNATVTVANQAYDPSINYSGCYPSGRIYYSSSGNTPGCGSGSYFNASALQCDNAVNEYSGNTIIDPDGPLEVSGFYTTQFAQKRRNRFGNPYWDRIRIRRSSDRNFLV